MRTALMVLLILGLVLSGCVRPSEPVQELAPSLITATGFWSFPHDGGDLRLDATQGRSEVQLFTPTDLRVGTFALDAQRPSVVIPNAPAGAWVLHLIDGPAPHVVGLVPVTRFVSLAPSVERHVIIDRPMDLLRLPGLGDRPVPATTVEIALSRAPVAIGVLGIGSHEGLQLMAKGARGPLLELESDRYVPIADQMEDLGGEAFPQNIRDRHVIVELEADHLDGALVLEAISYSRATPVEAPTQPAVAGPFSYGVIPGRPSSFDVHPEAGHVTFTANGTASVAVWGPDDARIATLMLEDETRSLALGSGRHVVMAIQGEAALGAPRAPADLELHPLEIRLERFAPTGNAEGTYRFVEHTSQAEGPVFAMIPSRDGASISINCAPALMRVLQGGEVVGAWHAGGPLLAGGAERVLGDGPIQVTLEGAAQGACLIGSIELAYFVHP